MFTDLLLSEASSGLDLARQLRRENPRVPIIATSGDNAGPIDTGELAELGIRYLPKPCSREMLETTLREYLDQSQRGDARSG